MFGNEYTVNEQIIPNINQNVAFSGLNDNGGDIHGDDDCFPGVGGGFGGSFGDLFADAWGDRFGFGGRFGGAGGRWARRRDFEQFEQDIQQQQAQHDKLEHLSSVYQVEQPLVMILIDIPFVIPFELRVKLFYALIEHEKDKIESRGGSKRANFGNAIQIKIRRNHVLDDGFR